MYIKCQQTFDDDISNAKIKMMNGEKLNLEKLDSIRPSANNKKKINSLQQRSMLWKSSAKFCLSSVISSSGVIHDDKDSMADALRTDWSPTVQATPDCFRQHLALEELKPFVQNASETWGKIRPPDTDKFYKSSQFAKPSKPGPDTAPYSGWCSLLGAETLQLMFFWLSSVLFWCLTFNDSFAAFLPKGDQAEDSKGFISRSTSDVRPLGLKNSNDKIIDITANRAFSPITSSHVHEAQNGFCSGRNFLHNCIDIDTHGRISSYEHLWHLLPIILTFDFAAAFASIYHSFIFWLLGEMGCPQSTLNLLQAFYFSARVSLVGLKVWFTLSDTPAASSRAALLAAQFLLGQSIQLSDA